MLPDFKRREQLWGILEQQVRQTLCTFRTQTLSIAERHEAGAVDTSADYHPHVPFRGHLIQYYSQAREGIGNPCASRCTGKGRAHEQGVGQWIEPQAGRRGAVKPRSQARHRPQCLDLCIGDVELSPWNAVCVAMTGLTRAKQGGGGGSRE